MFQLFYFVFVFLFFNVWLNQRVLYLNVAKITQIIPSENHLVVIWKTITYFSLKRQLCFGVRKFNIAPPPFFFVHQIPLWNKVYVPQPIESIDLCSD